MDDSIPGNLFDTDRMSSPSTETESPVSEPGCEDDDDLLANFFELHEVHFFKDEESLRKDTCSNVQLQFHAYDYAAKYWTYHFARCQHVVDEAAVNMALRLLSCEPGRHSDWVLYQACQSYVQFPSVNDSSPIVLAAMFDFARVVEILLVQQGQSITSSSLNSALFWAASRGSHNSVKTLLEYGVPTSSIDRHKVPLIVATCGNFKDVCALLLENHGVDPNKPDLQGKPALVLAAEADHEQILHLLLSHNRIHVDRTDHIGLTALMSACQNGSVDCVRRLREDGRADVNRLDHKGQTALHYACRAGHAPVLKELFKFSQLDFHVIDNDGRNAMSFAAEHGHLSVVKLLHRKKVDVASTDLRGRNSISWAANSRKATTKPSSGDESVLEYLTRKAPQAVDSPDESGWSPLAWALDPPGCLESVQLLSRFPQANLNRCDRTFGRCLLAWAASGGLTEIVKCLLHRPEVDRNSSDFDGQTPLSYAAAYGMTEVVKILLQDKAVDVVARDRKERTAADWARSNNHLELAELLSNHIYT